MRHPVSTPRRATAPPGRVRASGGVGGHVGAPHIKVGERSIGEGAPCYVIAEAGSNHNGSLPQALARGDLSVDDARGKLGPQRGKANTRRNANG